MAAPAQAVPAQSMQGILVPASSVDPRTFFQRTRRLIFPQKTFSYAGLGFTDTIPILQTGIISGISVKVTGTVVVTLGGGTCATTMRWPYDLIRAVRVNANGQSNLINVSGQKLAVRRIMSRGDIMDRGVSRGVGGASPGTATVQGTLSLASESWGLGQGVTAIPGAPTTYTYDLEWYIPIAFDEVSLMGAIFAQTAATDLNIAIDWAPSSDLFVLTGAATAVVTANCVIEAKVFSIPQGPQGDIIIPDLSVFHSLIQSRFSTLVNGDNEIRLAGQGVGRQLLRVYAQTWNGTGQASAPLTVTSANYGQMGWRFGGNDTPEVLTDGQHKRYFDELTFSDDIGGVEGFWCFDFASENAFRDSVDEGAATELRLLTNIASGVTLASPVLEYVQETVFAGAVGA